MKVAELVEVLGTEFYAGVPDSLLKPLGDYLMQEFGSDGKRHIVAANEGNAAAIAAGYHLATGKVAAVYMQNSGQGNIVNPFTSLLHPKVYGIPVIFIIGWRGEPGKKDEPQHIYQGEITCSLLDELGISFMTVDEYTEVDKLRNFINAKQDILSHGGSVALVVTKDALEYEEKVKCSNDYDLKREQIIERILEYAKGDPIISTTGKSSRELFELREAGGEGHERDFLTVGSMGHSSSIALGIALQQPEKRIWCLDGDGAAIMHMGAMAVIGQLRPHNLIHVVINNEAHETVGGLPTAAIAIDLCAIAKGCGYERVHSARNAAELDSILREVKNDRALDFIEIKSAIGSRKDLGRPTKSPAENKSGFMKYLQA